MSNANHVESAARLAASLALVFMVSAYGQTTGSGAATNVKSPPPSTRESASASPTSKASKNDDLTRSDRTFMTKAVQGGLAEVELGRIAAQKATDPQVKQFAQRMVDDHGKANDKLKQVATSKNLTLPTDPPSNAKREEDKLNKLSGEQFDKEYMKHMLSDHKKDVSLFRSTAKSAKNSDVKQFASETLPTLEQHLLMAQTIAKSK